MPARRLTAAVFHSRQALQILAEALRPDAGGAAAAARRCTVADWPAVIALANAHFVSATLFTTMSRADDWDTLPDELRDYLALLHEQNGLRNKHVRQQAEEAIAAFNAAGIAPMLLKGGAALFLDLYGDPAARMIRDLDFLVPKAQLEAAMGVLKGLGYRAVTLYPEGHNNACGDFARDGYPCAIDLHFELIDAPYLLTAAEVWRRAQPLALPWAVAYAPSPNDAVLHNILHAQIHHTGNYYRGSFELRQLCDFVMLVRRYPYSVNWRVLANHLRRHKLSTMMQSYLLAAEQLLDLAWPLQEQPSRWARWQMQRSLLQIRIPFLERLSLPLANLCAAFAHHRMDGLYGVERSLLWRRLQHGAQFLRKSNGEAVIARLFKAHSGW